jgi:hypothetical protein
MKPGIRKESIEPAPSGNKRRAGNTVNVDPTLTLCVAAELHRYKVAATSSRRKGDQKIIQQIKHYLVGLFTLFLAAECFNKNQMC